MTESIETPSSFWHAKAAIARNFANRRPPVDAESRDTLCKIARNLYLSSCHLEAQKSVLQEHGVTHVLQVGKELAPTHPSVFTYKNVSVYDLEEEDLVKYFPECFDFINSGRDAGGVLVHCAAGISRSATVVIAYLMAHGGLSLEDARAAVKTSRPAINPNQGFMLQLQLFQDAGCSAEGWQAWNLERFLQARSAAYPRGESSATSAHVRGACEVAPPELGREDSLSPSASPAASPGRADEGLGPCPGHGKAGSGHPGSGSSSLAVAAAAAAAGATVRNASGSEAQPLASRSKRWLLASVAAAAAAAAAGSAGFDSAATAAGDVASERAQDQPPEGGQLDLPLLPVLGAAVEVGPHAPAGQSDRKQQQALDGSRLYLRQRSADYAGPAYPAPSRGAGPALPSPQGTSTALPRHQGDAAPSPGSGQGPPASQGPPVAYQGTRQGGPPGRLAAGPAAAAHPVQVQLPLHSAPAGTVGGNASMGVMAAWARAQAVGGHPGPFEGAWGAGTGAPDRSNWPQGRQSSPSLYLSTDSGADRAWTMTNGMVLPTAAAMQRSSLPVPPMGASSGLGTEPSHQGLGATRAAVTRVDLMSSPQPHPAASRPTAAASQVAGAASEHAVSLVPSTRVGVQAHGMPIASTWTAFAPAIHSDHYGYGAPAEVDSDTVGGGPAGPSGVVVDPTTLAPSAGARRHSVLRRSLSDRLPSVLSRELPAANAAAEVATLAEVAEHAVEGAEVGVHVMQHRSETQVSAPGLIVAALLDTVSDCHTDSSLSNGQADSSSAASSSTGTTAGGGGGGGLSSAGGAGEGEGADAAATPCSDAARSRTTSGAGIGTANRSVKGRGAAHVDGSPLGSTAALSPSPRASKRRGVLPWSLQPILTPAGLERTSSKVPQTPAAREGGGSPGDVGFVDTLGGSPPDGGQMARSLWPASPHGPAAAGLAAGVLTGLRQTATGGLAGGSATGGPGGSHGTDSSSALLSHLLVALALSHGGSPPGSGGIGGTSPHVRADADLAPSRTNSVAGSPPPATAAAAVATATAADAAGEAQPGLARTSGEEDEAPPQRSLLQLSPTSVAAAAPHPHPELHPHQQQSGPEGPTLHGQAGGGAAGSTGPGAGTWSAAHSHPGGRGAAPRASRLAAATFAHRTSASGTSPADLQRDTGRFTTSDNGARGNASREGGESSGTSADPLDRLLAPSAVLTTVAAGPQAGSLSSGGDETTAFALDFSATVSGPAQGYSQVEATLAPAPASAPYPLPDFRLRLAVRNRDSGSDPSSNAAPACGSATPIHKRVLRSLTSLLGKAAEGPTGHAAGGDTAAGAANVSSAVAEPPGQQATVTQAGAAQADNSGAGPGAAAVGGGGGGGGGWFRPSRRRLWGGGQAAEAPGTSAPAPSAPQPSVADNSAMSAAAAAVGAALAAGASGSAPWHPAGPDGTGPAPAVRAAVSLPPAPSALTPFEFAAVVAASAAPSSGLTARPVGHLLGLPPLRPHSDAGDIDTGSGGGGSPSGGTFPAARMLSRSQSSSPTCASAGRSAAGSPLPPRLAAAGRDGLQSGAAAAGLPSPGRLSIPAVEECEEEPSGREESGAGLRLALRRPADQAAGEEGKTRVMAPPMVHGMVEVQEDAGVVGLDMLPEEPFRWGVTGEETGEDRGRPPLAESSIVAGEHVSSSTLDAVGGHGGSGAGAGAGPVGTSATAAAAARAQPQSRRTGSRHFSLDGSPVDFMSAMALPTWAAHATATHGLGPAGAGAGSVGAAAAYIASLAAVASAALLPEPSYPVSGESDGSSRAIQPSDSPTGPRAPAGDTAWPPRALLPMSSSLHRAASTGDTGLAVPVGVATSHAGGASPLVPAPAPACPAAAPRLSGGSGGHPAQLAIGQGWTSNAAAASRRPRSSYSGALSMVPPSHHYHHFGLGLGMAMGTGPGFSLGVAPTHGAVDPPTVSPLPSPLQRTTVPAASSAFGATPPYLSMPPHPPALLLAPVAAPGSAQIPSPALPQPSPPAISPSGTSVGGGVGGEGGGTGAGWSLPASTPLPPSWGGSRSSAALMTMPSEPEQDPARASSARAGSIGAGGGSALPPPEHARAQAQPTVSTAHLLPQHQHSAGQAATPSGGSGAVGGLGVRATVRSTSTGSAAAVHAAAAAAGNLVLDAGRNWDHGRGHRHHPKPHRQALDRHTVGATWIPGGSNSGGGGDYHGRGATAGQPTSPLASILSHAAFHVPSTAPATAVASPVAYGTTRQSGGDTGGSGGGSTLSVTGLSSPRTPPAVSGNLFDFEPLPPPQPPHAQHPQPHVLLHPIAHLADVLESAVVAAAAPPPPPAARPAVEGVPSTVQASAARPNWPDPSLLRPVIGRRLLPMPSPSRITSSPAVTPRVTDSLPAHATQQFAQQATPAAGAAGSAATGASPTALLWARRSDSGTGMAATAGTDPSLLPERSSSAARTDLRVLLPNEFLPSASTAVTAAALAAAAVTGAPPLPSPAGAAAAMASYGGPAGGLGPADSGKSRSSAPAPSSAVPSTVASVTSIPAAAHLTAVSPRGPPAGAATGANDGGSAAHSVSSDVARHAAVSPLGSGGGGGGGHSVAAAGAIRAVGFGADLGRLAVPPPPSRRSAENVRSPVGACTSNTNSEDGSGS